MSGSKGKTIAGWIVSGVVAAFLCGPSAGGKFFEWDGKETMFTDLGFTIQMMYGIGILEVVITILYLIPRTAFIGAILLTGYLGGATVTHVRVSDPFFFPILIGVVMWIGLALRRPEIFTLAIGAPIRSESK